MSEEKRYMSGFTKNEAKEFHRMFMVSTAGFVGLTVVAHILVWAWRPWF